MVKVLLVEDVHSHQHLISHWLETSGFEVVIASDGPAGLDAAQRGADTIDLTLLDLKLAYMDGQELASRLKADDRTRQIPVIAVTAYAMAQDHLKAIAQGCDDYLSKPINVQDLLDKVRMWTARRGPRDTCTPA